jgi:hypothetical protein
MARAESLPMGRLPKPSQELISLCTFAEDPASICLTGIDLERVSSSERGYEVALFLGYVWANSKAFSVCQAHFSQPNSLTRSSPLATMALRSSELDSTSQIPAATSSTLIGSTR